MSFPTLPRPTKDPVLMAFATSAVALCLLLSALFGSFRTGVVTGVVLALVVAAGLLVITTGHDETPRR